MGKPAKPRTSKNPPKGKDSGSEAEVERQEQAQLVPPAHRLPPLFRVLEAVRAAVGRVLDLADAAAEAVTKGLQPRS
jgi:hypothetical protein